ncbi:hypothetical protein MRI28_11000 [Nocardiopsis dassonvillei]|uniref:hypothetical protein n=1 Tax=Nocardiopsis dassonvillei TaxID=2014 RepID=UPI00200E5D57|nr:hypothetical protein [Nocardiopsis dassonvillei]MCK9870160.1 hypothetical protein [Nocardiopsis dassonvillei]
MAVPNEILSRLRGQTDYSEHNDQVREDSLRQKRKDSEWVRERSALLHRNGVRLPEAEERAKRELRAQQREEAAKAARQRVDESVREIHARENERASGDVLREAVADRARNGSYVTPTGERRKR